MLIWLSLHRVLFLWHIADLAAGRVVENELAGKAIVASVSVCGGSSIAGVCHCKSVILHWNLSPDIKHMFFVRENIPLLNETFSFQYFLT